MPDYSKGKIYKVINTQNEIVYIGSTIQQLSCRFCRHTHKGGGNKIILIEDCPCNCKEHLIKREQEIIDQYNNLLNQKRAYRSDEYLKEYNKEQSKKYYENNKDKLKEKEKKYRIDNKEKIKIYHKEYRIDNKKQIKEKDKKYYENNKEEINKKHKKYYENNKEKISKKAKEKYKEKYKEKIKCDLCNAEVNKSSLLRHKKTKKCIINRINCD